MHWEDSQDEIYIYNQLPSKGRSEFISYSKGETLHIDNESCEELFTFSLGKIAPRKSEIPIQVSDRGITHNLPTPDWYHFVQRPELEDDAIEKLIHPRMYITTFDGTGGCGKTALALKLAYNLISHPIGEPQFDYIVWITAKSTKLDPDGIRVIDQQLTSLADLLREILRVVGFSDLAEMNKEDMLKAHVFDILAMARFLIIIDNLETVQNASEIWDFLIDRKFAYPTKVIVTSRHYQRGTELVVNVRGMTKDQVRSLIKTEADRLNLPDYTSISDSLLNTLYEKTGGIPIAIKQVIAHTLHGISLRNAIERLPSRPQDILDFCYPESFKLLDQNAKLIFFVLSKLPSPSGINELRFLSGLNEDELENSTRQLAKLSLLESLSAGEQGSLYYLLPLTKEFALRELSNFSDIELDIISKLNDLEQLRQMSSAFSDIPSIAGIVTSERMLQLALVSATRYSFDKADFWFRKAIEADRNNPQVWLAKAKYEYRDKQNLEAARHDFLKATDLSENEDAYIGWGHVERAEKNWDKAVDLFSKAVDLNQDSKFGYHGLALTLYEKGAEEKGHGKMSNDAHRIRRGQELIRKSIPKFLCALYKNPANEIEKHHNAVTFQVLSRAYNRLNELEKAISSCEEALRLEPYNTRVVSWLQQLKRWKETR